MLICPKGIECTDTITGETLLKVSIYEISYCAVDAKYSNIFAFVAKDMHCVNATTSDSEMLTCHAFVCSKRKLAHKLTLTVAKNFDRAYRDWQENVQRRKQHMDVVDNDDTAESIANRHSSKLLIDFNADTEPKNYEQYAASIPWVMFDDDIGEENHCIGIHPSSVWNREIKFTV